jgi:hypothetical protein
MEKDSTNGQMAEHTQDNMRLIRKRASVFTPGPMANNTKVSGAMACKMASVASLIQKDNQG